MTAIRVRPTADRDIQEVTDHYLEQASLDVALNFLDAIDLVFERLLERSYIGSPVHASASRLAGMRCWPVPSFERHLVFYFASDDFIEIVRVLHGARDVQGTLTDADWGN